MPPCHEYNPNPPTFPSPPDLKRVVHFDVTPPGDLAPAFFNYYHRSQFNYQFVVGPDGKTRLVQGPPPNASDSIILTDAQVGVIRGDTQVITTTSAIINRLTRTRVRNYLNRLNCDESGCFNDSGMEVTPTEEFSDQSYALGNFSIYWRAHCDVGPRRCELDLPNCAAGMGSEADYELHIYWRLYDIYDFTGWQNIIPFSWFGTDFLVFGEWETVHRGVVADCAKRRDDFASIICQDDLELNTYYDITYAIVDQDTPCPLPHEEAVIDSAMGNLLGDGRDWCRTGHCRSERKQCEPRFSDISVTLGARSSENINERQKRCRIRVHVSAAMKCRCFPPDDPIPFPHPDTVFQALPEPSKKSRSKSRSPFAGNSLRDEIKRASRLEPKRPPEQHPVKPPRRR